MLSILYCIATLFVAKCILLVPESTEIIPDENKSIIEFQHQEFVRYLKFKENRGNDEFVMTLKFSKVECEWDTKHLYYTVDTGLALKANFHCHDEYKCKANFCLPGNDYYKTTEKQTEYTKNLCNQVMVNNYYCFPKLKPGCLFYSWSIIPNTTKIYEVREAIENFCHPTMIITIYRKDRHPEQHILEKAAYTYEFKNEKTYAYDKFRFQIKSSQKVQLKEPIYLLNKIEEYSKVYIVEASQPGIPKNGKIGEFQSLDLNFTNIMVDENMIKCTTEYNKVACEKTNLNINRYLQIIPTIKTVGNPEQANTLLGLNLYYLNRKNHLITILSKIKPITVTITHFRHHRVGNEKVRPCIYRVEYVSMKGCYCCNIPAILRLKIDNLCEEGNIFIDLDFANVYQQAVYIYTNTTWINIFFRAEQECIKGELCVKNDYEIRPSCVFISGCLIKGHSPVKSNYLSIMRESKVVYINEQNRCSILYYLLPYYIQNHMDEGFYIVFSDIISAFGILIMIYFVITIIFARLHTLNVQITELQLKLVTTYCPTIYRLDEDEQIF